MAKIFSWKIKNKTYAYLVEENGSYIRNKVTDDAELLRIATIVNDYTLGEYIENFNNMKSEVEAKYNVSMGTYDRYYDTDDTENTQFVILTGKDGDSFDRTTAESMLTEQDYNRIVTMMDEKIAELRSLLESSISSVENFASNQAQQAVTLATSAVAESNTAMYELATRMELAIESANTALESALPILQMEEAGLLTNATLRNVISTVNDNSLWISNNERGIAEMSNDYNTLKIAVGDDGGGLIFNQMLNKIDQCNADIRQTNDTMDSKIAASVDNSVNNRIDGVEDITSDVSAIVGEMSAELQATENRLNGQMSNMSTQITTISATTMMSQESLLELRSEISEISGSVITIKNKVDDLDKVDAEPPTDNT